MLLWQWQISCQICWMPRMPWRQSQSDACPHFCACLHRSSIMLECLWFELLGKTLWKIISLHVFIFAPEDRRLARWLCFQSSGAQSTWAWGGKDFPTWNCANKRKPSTWHVSKVSSTCWLGVVSCLAGAVSWLRCLLVERGWVCEGVWPWGIAKGLWRGLAKRDQ